MTDEAKDLLIANLMNKLEGLNPGSGKQILESIKFNNYLTESEYTELTGKLKNHDGTRGPKLSQEMIKSVLGKTKDTWLRLEPYYNDWALLFVINYVMSMYSKLIYEISTKTGIQSVLVCYDIATGMLKDRNKPKWLRKHFDLDD